MHEVTSTHLPIQPVHQFVTHVLQCWRQWQESVEENKRARVALSFLTNITLRKAFNQWLVWARERQEYGTKLHLAVHVRPLPLLCKQLQILLEGSLPRRQKNSATPLCCPQGQPARVAAELHTTSQM